MFSAYGQLSKHEPKSYHLSLVYSVNFRWFAAEEEYANHQNPQIILKHNFTFSSQSLSYTQNLFPTAKEAWLSFSIISRPLQVKPLIISEMAQKEHWKEHEFQKSANCIISLWLIENWISRPWYLCLFHTPTTLWSRNEPITMTSRYCITLRRQGEAGSVWSRVGCHPSICKVRNIHRASDNQIQFRLVSKGHRWLFLSPNVIV